MINNIGENNTKYHWREFASISKELVGAFPEYELNKVIKNYNNLKPIQNGEIISSYREN